ncbi:MAG: DUF1499 domain-containing protein [Spirochaetales bacterium]|nr:DUF1499 domain-containing protein [Spirochaetales bacterium]
MSKILLFRNYLLGIIFTVFLIIAVSCAQDGKIKEVDRFSVCPDSPNCVSSLAEPQDEIHFIPPLNLSLELPDAFIKVRTLLEDHADGSIVVLEENSYIHAVFTSKIMRFKDDVEFRFQAQQDGGTLIDIKSRSRLGYSDLGVNRTRMEDIRSSLKGKIVP